MDEFGFDPEPLQADENGLNKKRSRYAQPLGLLLAAAAGVSYVIGGEHRNLPLILTATGSWYAAHWFVATELSVTETARRVTGLGRELIHNALSHGHPGQS